MDENGKEEVKREQRWQASHHYNFARFNWEEFIVKIANETFRHLEEIKKRPSSVRVVEQSDSDSDMEDD